jgi:hypothetical protein
MDRLLEHPFKGAGLDQLFLLPGPDLVIQGQLFADPYKFRIGQTSWVRQIDRDDL